MAVLRIVPFAVLTVALTLLSYTGMTSARSVALQRDTLSQLLSKRNSWWSKKSVDASSDFTGLVPGASLDEQDVTENIPDGSTELLVCYMFTCVPDFTACATHSRTTGAFDVCRMQHRHCAVHCLQMAQDDTSPMK